MNTPGLVTIDGIITHMQAAMQNFNPMFQRVLEDMVIRAVTNLNITCLSNISVAYLTPDPDSGICVLPSDYVRGGYTKVGVVIKGKIWTLTADDRIALPRNEQCGVTVRDMYKHNDVATINSLGGTSFASHYNNGVMVNNLMAIGGGYNYAYFRIDNETNTLVLDGEVITDQVILEYKSSGIKIGTTSYVPLSAQETVIATAFYYLTKDNENYTAVFRSEKKQGWEEQMRRQNAYENSLTKDEILDIFFGGCTQVARRNG